MKHLFIINPAAGSRDRTADYTAQIEKICGQRGITYQIEVSQAPGDCTRIAREAAETVNIRVADEKLRFFYPRGLTYR